MVGPMGSGKSAVGRQLATRLGLEFVDSDVEIESRTGVDVPYIFEREGEAGFRLRESEILDELTRSVRRVIATGGGAVLDPESRSRLR
ncbi:MAG: AAA family ATPase, partial [Steroidobacteraceae bacterium]|nr:AAA family ATPase [Steroidobacteraceae bacterium]